MAVTQEERAALALAALGEVTDPNDVGELLGVDEIEDGVIDLRFGCRLAAYAGWHWTVSTSDLPDGEVTVLEVELLPGDGALLAPAWVPWTERLADWRAQHADEEHPDDESDEDSDDAADAESDDDESELDDAEDDDTEDDLAVDDELDELDESELEGDLSPEESEQDSGDIDDEDDDSDDDAEEHLREV